MINDHIPACQRYCVTQLLFVCTCGHELCLIMQQQVKFSWHLNSFPFKAPAVPENIQHADKRLMIVIVISSKKQQFSSTKLQYLPHLQPHKGTCPSFSWHTIGRMIVCACAYVCPGGFQFINASYSSFPSLYQGPHIASVTLAAYECGSTDFPEPPYPDQIVCPQGGAVESSISLFSIMSKVRLEACMWVSSSFG